MKRFTSELQHLDELYLQLENRFSDLRDAPSNNDTAPLAASTLAAGDLLRQVEPMDSRTAELAQEWETLREQIDPKVSEGVRCFAQALADKARQISLFCGGLIQGLEREREGLQGALAELRKGAQYLDTIKPVKTNYPKFLDSLG